MKTIADSWIEKGMQQGIQQGMQQGKTERDFQIARNMKGAKASVNFISQVTGLSIEQIKKL
ncbi:hypothetical protein [Rickettsia endosymbiont of Cardiosporidium cionae]|uniref:hypothetical protein n=1 Tax=Rickettsia endosymbiont of Cardiosporidium cionae TaxID=2777155 RepID=UPI001894F877|nr:hypothetical protein [Rickettsia endosymbiont of Cardiosporidium cionae]KAF8818033.1 transposase [Rickettsia endosymbiont of Cardiosporidium cionae]